MPAELTEPLRGLMKSAKAYRLEEDFDRTISALDQAIAETEKRGLASDVPTLERGYICRGVVRALRGELQLADEDFAQALNLNPSSHWAYYNMGVTREHLDDVKGAINYYTTALEHRNAHYKSLLRRGMLFKRQGLHGDARKDFAVLRSIHDRWAHVRGPLDELPMLSPSRRRVRLGHDDTRDAVLALGTKGGVAWLEQNIASPICPEWGRLLYSLKPEWAQLDRWIRLSQLHCLAAVDALLMFAPSARCDDDTERELCSGANAVLINDAISFALDHHGTPLLQDGRENPTNVAHRWRSR